jgi:FemAB-related protein (PEP-CTERM system-associated)
MKVELLTESNQSLWRHFVDSNPKATYYHLLGWRDVFNRTFGYPSYYSMAVDDGGVVQGILPMFLMPDILQRKYLVSNPFSNFAGLCANSLEAEQSLVEHAKKIAHETRARYIELRQLGEPLSVDLPAKESFVTLMLNLPTDADDIWQALKSRNRGKVRKAEKNGLQVDFGMQYLEDFHVVYSENLRYLGTPIFPLRMFRTITEVFKDQVELLVLKLNDEVVSGMFLFKCKNMLSEPWVASRRKYNRIYVNNYLYWQAIKYGCQNGFELFDFGRSTADTGTYDFKLQWGARPVQLYYQYHLNTASEIPVVDAKNNRYQTLIDIWKKMPLALTNFIGPRVVQYLPEL